MIWLQLIAVVVCVLGGVVVIVKFALENLKRAVRQAMSNAATQLRTEYEDKVHRQSLVEARRLLDANRSKPARVDSGAPAVVHRPPLRKNQ